MRHFGAELMPNVIVPKPHSGQAITDCWATDHLHVGCAQRLHGIPELVDATPTLEASADLRFLAIPIYNRSNKYCGNQCARSTLIVQSSLHMDEC
jgi:hypothetical protein